MAVVFFLDGNDEPLANGDSYAEEADIESLMTFNQRWNTLLAATKEKFIKAATKRIDLLSVSGDPVDINQPLTFPREFNNQEPAFTIQAQKRALRASVAAIVENDLNRLPINLTYYNYERETINPKGQTIPREALQQLWRYLN